MYESLVSKQIDVGLYKKMDKDYFNALVKKPVEL